jgi:hypothetical protein
MCWKKCRQAGGIARDDGFCYLFLHIAKCAGSSVIERLVTLGQQGVHLFEECQTKHEAREVFRQKLHEQQIDPSQVRAIYGHRVFAELAAEVARPTRLAFFLREPASIFVSAYNYLATIALDASNPYYRQYRAALVDKNDRLITFREWLAGFPMRNPIMSFLYHAVAGDKPPGDSTEVFSTRHLNVCKSVIDQAHFVGLFESIEQDGPAFLRIVGLEDTMPRVNVSRKLFDVRQDPRVRDLIEDQNALDCELYRYAVRQRARRALAA